MIGKEMVNIVTALPPSYGEATTEICNEDSYQSIIDKVLSDTSMSSIVGSEHDLMLHDC